MDTYIGKQTITQKPKHNLELLELAAIFVLGLLVRLLISKITEDMSNFYFIWYQNTLDNGIACCFNIVNI